LDNQALAATFILQHGCRFYLVLRASWQSWTSNKSAWLFYTS